MSTTSLDTKNIFQSMTQPLRKTKQAQNGLSAKDLDFDKKRIVTPKAVFPKKEEERPDKFLFMEYKELSDLEKKNSQMLSSIGAIFSQPGFQKLFNSEEKKLVQRAGEFMSSYDRTHKKLLQSNLNEPLTTIDKIEALYPIAYLKLQQQMIVFLPELFALTQLFRSPRMHKKIEHYFGKESISMGKMSAKSGTMADPRAFILHAAEGDMASMMMQWNNRRALILREVIKHMKEDSEEEKRVKKIYEQAEKVNIFANEMMQEAEKVNTSINQDPFCLRELLCFDKDYRMIMSFVDEEDKKKINALRFLRDLSLRTKEGIFANANFMNRGVVIAFALKYVGRREVKKYMKSRNYATLVEALIARVERDLELVETILRKFVTSDYFIARADLKQKTNENDEKYHARLKSRILNGGETIKLFTLEQEERRKWKPTAPLKPESLPKSEPKTNKKKSNKKILKGAGLAAPFLVLATIPFVGPIISLACFCVLGIASLAYYFSPDDEDRKEGRKSQKKVDGHEESRYQQQCHSLPEAENDNLINRRKRRHRSNVVIGKRESIYRDTDMAMMADISSSADLSESAVVDKQRRVLTDVTPCLGSGRWFKEDEKRRRPKSADNDSVNMHNVASASEQEVNHYGLFSDGDNDSELTLSGYRSFPEIDEDEFDLEKPTGNPPHGHYTFGHHK